MNSIGCETLLNILHINLQQCHKSVNWYELYIVPPPSKRGGGSKFWLPLPEVGYEKLKKGWKYGPGAGLFKGGGGAGTFPI